MTLLKKNVQRRSGLKHFQRVSLLTLSTMTNKSHLGIYMLKIAVVAYVGKVNAEACFTAEGASPIFFTTNDIYTRIDRRFIGGYYLPCIDKDIGEALELIITAEQHNITGWNETDRLITGATDEKIIQGHNSMGCKQPKIILHS